MIDGKSADSWLPTLKLTTVEQSYIENNEEICDAVVNAFMTILNKDFPHLHFQSSCLFAELLEYAPFDTIHVHHNRRGHFCTSSSIGQSVRVYDSLNIKPTEDLIHQINSLSLLT